MSQFLTPSDVLVRNVTLRQAAFDSSLGRHNLYCKCTRGCATNRCKWKRFYRTCSSRYHKHMICQNLFHKILTTRLACNNATVAMFNILYYSLVDYNYMNNLLFLYRSNVRNYTRKINLDIHNTTTPRIATQLLSFLAWFLILWLIPWSI